MGNKCHFRLWLKTHSAEAQRCRVKIACSTAWPCSWINIPWKCIHVRVCMCVYARDCKGNLHSTYPIQHQEQGHVWKTQWYGKMPSMWAAELPSAVCRTPFLQSREASPGSQGVLWEIQPCVFPVSLCGQKTLPRGLWYKHLVPCVVPGTGTGNLVGEAWRKSNVAK